jgi:hypothetical protein
LFHFLSQGLGPTRIGFNISNIPLLVIGNDLPDGQEMGPNLYS